MASVQVSGCPTWPEVARVLACLFEKDVEFQLIRPCNYKGLKRMPSIQGKGLRFSYQDGDGTRHDSREICKHIAETYAHQGNKDLLAKTGTVERDSIDQWLKTEVEIFDRPSTELVLNLGFKLPMEADREVIEKDKQRLNEVLDEYEKRLQETKFLAGDKFTLADLFHLPNTQFLVSNDECCSLIRSRKRVIRWWDKISLRPSWQRVVEMQQEISLLSEDTRRHRWLDIELRGYLRT
ncbi:glutathione S-transferase F10 [Cocos nucifera]|uniref:glutathione transferase n=1 Tax=Cocos nucifera TaxID=13894 RepID=A0A8K0N848_COCNU|nr:glutathione S-transferase F10 [Cocos nucifera]